MSIGALLDPFTSVLTILNSIGGKYSSVSAFRNQKDIDSIQFALNKLTIGLNISQEEISSIRKILHTFLLTQDRHEIEIKSLKKEVEKIGISFHSLLETLNSIPHGKFLVEEDSHVVKTYKPNTGNKIDYNNFSSVISDISDLTDCEIISSAFIPSPEKLKSSIMDDPEKYLWHITNLREGIFRPSETSMIPVIFNINREQYLGWQKEEVIRSDFGIEIDNSRWNLDGGKLKNPIQNLNKEDRSYLSKKTSRKSKNNFQLEKNEYHQNFYSAKFLYRCNICSYLIGIETRGPKKTLPCLRCDSNILVGKEIIPSFVL